jgi:hypothetical protein
MALGCEGLTFISYSRKNKEFALQLAKELKAAGFCIWLDQLDIPTGVRWDDELEKALENCEIFMVILTPASIESENVKDEIGYAIDSQKHILPVLLENAKVPLRLRRFQYVDFTGKSHAEGVEAAKQLLMGFLGQKPIPTPEHPPLAAPVQENETERLSKQKAGDETAASTKTEAKPQIMDEVNRIAAPKIETITKGKEKVVPAEDAKAVLASPTSTQMRMFPKGLVIGIVAVVALIIAGIGFNAFSHRTSTPATKDAPIISSAATKVMATQISGPFVLSPDEAKLLAKNTSVKGFYSLAQGQYTEAQLKDFIDKNQPIMLKLTIPTPLKLGYVDCAKTQAILEDNLLHIIYTFKFMGNTIPESDFASDDFPADNGDACRITYIIIDKWVTGQYHVYQGVAQTKTINDGYSNTLPYSEGQEYIVTIP